MTYILSGTILTAGSLFQPVEFSDVQIVKYYCMLIQSFFSEYSWQMVTSYNITFYSIIALIFLFGLFCYKVWRQQKRDKIEKRLRDYYVDRFRRILGSAEELTRVQMLEVLGNTDEEVRRNDPYYYAHLLEQARMEMYEIVYLPNMQTLAETLGVCGHFEQMLLLRKDVFKTLQMMLMLQLRVNEGRLANYVNHSNPQIRMMARLNYIVCSSNEPYRYLVEDLNEEQSLYRPMILNYVFGWMKYQDKHMPNFLILSEQVTNEESAAYLVHEVAYWGKEDEKENVKNYFLADRMKIRSAAIEVVATLQDRSAEDLLVQSYYHQPEDIRIEVLKALMAIGSGRQTEFFKKAYEISSSRETRETALRCLYNYGNDGRRLFEIMRHEANDEERKLIDQVDSFVLLEELRTMNF
ncbi:MAG: HEAT repeat domain-containing protein [Prevotella sp.]|nr:HEAT repeat domain-containing protein [Candidatus Prevotella equi]